MAPSILVLAPPTLIDLLRARTEERFAGGISWFSLAAPPASADLHAAGVIVLINVNLDDFSQWRCRLGEHVPLVDMVAHGDPQQARQHGWMIGAGGPSGAVQAATRLLDALSPSRPRAWLHLGNASAGAFIAALLQRWQHQSLAILGWLGGTSSAQWAYDPAIWQCLTQSTLNQTREHAAHYLGLVENLPFEPAHPIPAPLQQVLPDQPHGLMAPATTLAHMLLSLPAVAPAAPS
ncbi:hypothetical protein [Jeongeupia sp. HS-3]|uniref:hypothetical protein n=1 Tax=Jeongeupia sp. HS-3 TaxID=1009682 RepID=UPI0019103B87|nr:hypothetical protein [Jeongeupia sp. HS-3]